MAHTTMRKRRSSIYRQNWRKVSQISSASELIIISLQVDFKLILRRYAVDAQQGVENVVVVDNIPIIDEGKRQRLVDRLRALFDKAGAGVDEDRISMPWDDAAGTNKG